MNNIIFLSKTNYDFKGKKVLLRLDCDVDLKDVNGKLVVDEDFRLKAVLLTIKYLLEKGAAEIIMLGHMGRPDGKTVEELRLTPAAEWFSCHSGLASPSEAVRSWDPESIKIEEQSSENYENYIDSSLRWNDKVYKIDKNEKVFLLENLRFNKEEEENDEGFVKDLCNLGDVFVNDAFGVSHREHASITGIPKFLPGFLGLNFENEIRVLGNLRENAKRPLVFVLGGSKKDKLEYLEFLGGWCDKVLIGGKLPILIDSSFLDSFVGRDDKVLVAKLNESKKDLSEDDIKLFEEKIKEAKTAVWAGPMGVYEEKENQKGTFEIAKAVTEVNGSRIAGGGDTHRIISWLNLWNKFDFVSSGGGAMLAFLKNGTLPGIEAIKYTPSPR